MSMKNSSDTIGNGARDLPACSAVPPSTNCATSSVPRTSQCSYVINMANPILRISGALVQNNKKLCGIWNRLFLCYTSRHNGWSSPHNQGFTFTQTHRSRQDSSRKVISSSQRPLPDNTQHSQQTNILSPGGIRTHNPSMQAAADPLLRPRDHWDRLLDISELL